MHGFSIDHCPGARYRASHARASLGQSGQILIRTLRRDKTKISTVNIRPLNRSITLDFAQPARRSRRRHQVPAECQSASGDDAEHFTRRRLMLQRLAQFRLRSPSSLNSRTFSMAITAWSAKVLRRAICLSENGRTSVSSNYDCADRNAFPQQWRGKNRPSACSSLTARRETRFQLSAMSRT